MYMVRKGLNCFVYDCLAVMMLHSYFNEALTTAACCCATYRSDSLLPTQQMNTL